MNTIVDTLRCVRLRKKLFEAYNISKSTAYRILNSESARCSNSVHKRGRKPVLSTYKCDAVKAVEDSAFRFTASSYYANASAIGLANGSERAIQRNMAEHGVGTYRAQQKKFIHPKNVEKRGI
jgi:hypothetical protein